MEDEDDVSFFSSKIKEEKKTLFVIVERGINRQKQIKTFSMLL